MHLLGTQTWATGTINILLQEGMHLLWLIRFKARKNSTTVCCLKQVLQITCHSCTELTRLSILIPVMAIYSQVGSEGHGHSWQPDPRSIGAVLYIPVQLFKYLHHCNWQSRHTHNAAIDIDMFSCILSHQLLYQSCTYITTSTDACACSAEKKGCEAAEALQSDSEGARHQIH